MISQKSTKIKKSEEKHLFSKKSFRNLTTSNQYRSQESSKRQSPETFKTRKSGKDGKKSEDKEFLVSEPQKPNQKYLIEEFFESSSYKNSLEKYKKLYQKKELHEAISDFLINENQNHDVALDKSSNLLRLEIMENIKEFEFDYGDLEKIFSNFGKIEKIIVKPKGVAFVLYEDMISAYFGQKIMDNFLITETELKLKVQICVVEPENYEKKESIFEKNDDEIYAKFVIPYNVGNDLIEPEIIEGHLFFTKLYIEIGDTNFDLINRILGIKGCNFSRIYYLCNKNLEDKSLLFDERSLNLKLEVIKEDKTEACVIISASLLDRFNQAVRFTHELLANVYEEYKKYCELKGMIYSSNLHIKKLEKFIQEPELKFLESKVE